MRDVEYTEAEKGGPPPEKRQKYRMLEDRILNIVMDYEQ